MPRNKKKANKSQPKGVQQRTEPKEAQLQQQQQQQQRRTEQKEAKQRDEPSTPPPKEPVYAAPASDGPSKRRLPVAQSPTPHSTGNIREYDDEGVKILSLPKIRSKLPKEASQRVQEALEDLRGGKRSISQLSNLTINAPSPKQRIIEKDRDAAESIIEATLQSKEKELAAAEKVVAILNEQWHAGTLDITQGTFEAEIEKLERRITALKGDTVVIRTSRHELSGRMLDDIIWRQDGANADWAYLDLLISRYKTPEGARLSLFAPRDNDAQSRFRKNVIKAYGADDGEGGRWCVISGQWHETINVNAAHIVRYNVGEPSARHLFGPPDDKDGHLMSAKNGIPMHEAYEKALDDARLVIIPDGDPETGRWKTYYLHEADASKKSRALPIGRELHGRSLQFQTEFRPAARYLYFAFCMNILRRQRHDVPGWWKDYLIGKEKVWATPGSYLRTSTLRRIARQIGHMTKEEAAIFAAEKGSGRITELADEEEEDEEMDSLHSSVIGSACSMQASPTPSTWKGKRIQRGDESGEGEE